MNTDERKLSKLYRKIVTTDEVRAILLFDKLDLDTREKVRKICRENGSTTATNILEKLDTVKT